MPASILQELWLRDDPYGGGWMLSLRVAVRGPRTAAGWMGLGESLSERGLYRAAIRRRIRPRLRARGQRGELLIESMITVALLGVLGTAALTALATLLMSALLNQRIVAAGSAASDFSEALERVPYISCATAASYRVNNANNAPVIDSLAALSGKYTVEIESVKYLQSVAPTASSAVFSTTCPSPDRGIQQFAIKVTSLNTDSETRGATRLVFTKRDETCPPDAVRPAEVVDGQPC